jgi:hypothetical protein
MSTDNPEAPYGATSKVNPIEEAHPMSLSDVFRNTARWRELKAEEYPEDERNAQSAAALHSLAEYVAHEDAADLVAALEPFVYDGPSLGGEQTSRVVSRYGYGYNAATTMQHREFLEELRVRCLEDAYEVAHVCFEDPTGELHEFEADAAAAGVFIPSSYWERRSRMTEAECAESISQLGDQAEAA